MKQYTKISDEDLAAYLENMLPKQDAAKVDDAMDIDTLEVLSVSRKVINEIHNGNVVELPSWKNVSDASVSIRPLREQFAMAGFLGNSDSDGENADDDDTETDN